jgi:hypothetical protein
MAYANKPKLQGSVEWNQKAKATIERIIKKYEGTKK